jgi:hypothetical protein
MATARRQTLRGWITTRGIRAETSGVHRRSARETVRASRPKMDRTFPGLKSKNSFSTEKNSKYVKSTNDIFYDRRRAKFKISKVWEDIKSPLD